MKYLTGSKQLSAENFQWSHHIHYTLSWSNHFSSVLWSTPDQFCKIKKMKGQSLDKPLCCCHHNKPNFTYDLRWQVKMWCETVLPDGIWWLAFYRMHRSNNLCSLNSKADRRPTEYNISRDKNDYFGLFDYLFKFLCTEVTKSLFWCSLLSSWSDKLLHYMNVQDLKYTRLSISTVSPMDRHASQLVHNVLGPLLSHSLCCTEKERKACHADKFSSQSPQATKKSSLRFHSHWMARHQPLSLTNAADELLPVAQHEHFSVPEENLPVTFK